MKKSLSDKLALMLRFLTPVRVIVIAVVGAFFWFVVLGDQGIYRRERLLEMKSRLTLENKALNDDIDRLTQEKRLLGDPANLEMVIRSELGYIRPGEVLFEEKK